MALWVHLWSPTQSLSSARKSSAKTRHSSLGCTSRSVRARVCVCQSKEQNVASVDFLYVCLFKVFFYVLTLCSVIHTAYLVCIWVIEGISGSQQPATRVVFPLFSVHGTHTASAVCIPSGVLGKGNSVLTGVRAAASP